MVPAKVTHLNWGPELVDELQPSISMNPWRYGTALEVLNGCHAFELENGSQRVLVAVRPVQRQGGVRLDVVGLVSTGDRFESAKVFDGLDHIANLFSADQIAMATAVPHIARQCQRAGWLDAGVLMTKQIGPLQ